MITDISHQELAAQTYADNRDHYGAQAYRYMQLSGAGFILAKAGYYLTHARPVSGVALMTAGFLLHDTLNAQSVIQTAKMSDAQSHLNALTLPGPAV